MFPNLNLSRIIYIVSNLIVIPGTIIPYIDFLSNLSFLVLFFILIEKSILLLLLSLMVFIFKNNANYRFNLLLKIKGDKISNSDPECVYLYAWCTLLRYFLIVLALNQISLFFI